MVDQERIRVLYDSTDQVYFVVVKTGRMPHPILLRGWQLDSKWDTEGAAYGRVEFLSSPDCDLYE